MKTAKDIENKETLSFDLQKTLPLPRIPTNIVYYKRQIMKYNLGIHSGQTDKGFFNVWVEGTAGRGSQEVGSCLKKYIDENCTGIEELVLWSDSCGGQNRNIRIVLMLKHILHNHPTLQKITMRFLIPGHSFLPNDSEFGDVESHLKCYQRLYTDEDYIRVMKVCRKKNPFTVTKLGKEDFFSTKNLEEGITNRKLDVEKNKINWLQFREIELKKDKLYSIFFRTAFTGPQQEVNLLKKKVGRPSPLFNTSLPLLWPEGKAISAPKLKDLKSMSGLISSDAKYFYKRFFANDNIEDDVDGFNAEVVDFDVDFE